MVYPIIAILTSDGINLIKPSSVTYFVNIKANCTVANLVIILYEF